MMDSNATAGVERLTQLICCELRSVLRKLPAKVFLAEGDAWEVPPELTVDVVCTRPVKGAGHIYTSMEAGLGKPDVDVEAHKALDLLVIPEKLVSELGREAVQGRGRKGRAAKVKTYAVVGLNDWLSWVFQTLLLLRWTLHTPPHCTVLVRCGTSCASCSTR